jgi:hypothetical protein
MFLLNINPSGCKWVSGMLKAARWSEAAIMQNGISSDFLFLHLDCIPLPSKYIEYGTNCN